MVKYTRAINYNTSSRLFWILSVLGIFLFFASGFLIIRTYLLSSRIVQRTGTQLLQIAQERKKSILEFVDSQRSKIALFADNQQIISLAQNLLKTYSYGAVGDYKSTSSEYKEFEKQLDQLLNQQNAIYEFKDIMLINADGKAFYTFKNELINIDLRSEKLHVTPLAQSFERARMTLTSDISEFGVDPELDAPALYMLRPLFDEQRFVAILAIQIDESFLYKIIQNYDNLGKSGDIFVTKNISDRVIFVAPSRLYSDVSFKKITDPSKEENTPTRLGTSGKTGFGSLLDAYNVPVIASWTFVPQVNLGLSVGIQYWEAAASIWWYKFCSWFFGIVFALYLLFIAHFLGHLAFLRRIKQFIGSLFFAKMMLLILSVAMLFVSGFIFWHRYSFYRKIVQQTTRMAESKVHTQVESIQQSLGEVEKITAQIAQDLKSNVLKKEDIKIRLLRDLKEVADLEAITIGFAPFAYDPEKRLFGFESNKVNGTLQANEITYDYMVPGASPLVQSDWYNKAIKEGPGWSEPNYGDSKLYYSGSKQTKAVYTLPFYLPLKQEPAGVIAITYNLGKIIGNIKNLEIGKLGYALLLTADGMLVYHPLEHYLKNKLSLIDIARENNNQALKDIAQKITSTQKGFWSYTDPIINTSYWLISEKITGVNWFVVGIFSNESLPLPLAKLRKELIWGIITLIIGLLLGAMLIARIWEGIEGIKRWSFMGGAILAATLIIFWNLTRMAPYEPTDEVIIVRDKTGLDKYIDLIDIDTQQRNEKKPVTIPTGIILYSVNFPDSNRVSISGYLWQKINKKDAIQPGVIFPEASESSTKEIFRKEDNGTETIGWNISATFLQRHRYSFFPFDKVHINILLATADFENHVILTPDFSGYKSYDVDPLPGITNEISIPGYTLERSFFSFAAIPAYDEVGLDALRKVTEKIRLHYNIILKRTLINPLIIFMLPLLIILFSIYAVFLVTQRRKATFDAFKSIGAYTGLFFSLIVLHQTLRSQVQSGELLYIEYFFFFTYVTILLLVLHALLLRISRTATVLTEKVSPYLKILFWPIQFAFWFAITMIIFYTLR
jgi:cell division protein FtsL